MTEITRVPLHPIAKGSMLKLWGGVVIAVAAAAGIACAAIPPLVNVTVLKDGTGEFPTRDDVVLVNYKGLLPNGKVFDEGQQAVFPVGEVVPGFAKGLEQMKRGGKYRLMIPSELGYGARQAGEIPPNTDLTFEIELIDFRNRAEIEQQRRLIEQLQGAGMVGGDALPPAVGGAAPGR